MTIAGNKIKQLHLIKERLRKENVRCQIRQFLTTITQLAGILLRILIKFRVSAADNWNERCTITGVRRFD